MNSVKVKGEGFKGKHLFAELYKVSFELLDNQEDLARVLIEAIAKGKATICGIQFKKFEPTGVTILALLSESHASIHTYPELGSLFLDVFTCGDCDPKKIFEHIVKELKPDNYILTEIDRGKKEEIES